MKALAARHDGRGGGREGEHILSTLAWAARREA